MGVMRGDRVVCKCRRGYAGRFDGKCGYCRTKDERMRHELWVRKGCPPVTASTPVWQWPKTWRI